MQALLVILTMTSLLGTPVTGHEPAEKKLHDFLLSEKYSKLIRPTGNSTVQLTVKLGMRLSQLLDVVRQKLVMSVGYLITNIVHVVRVEILGLVRLGPTVP